MAGSCPNPRFATRIKPRPLGGWRQRRSAALDQDAAAKGHPFRRRGGGRPEGWRRQRSSLTSTQTRKKPGLTLPDKPSIAVLPFTNMSGDPEQEFFADGVADDIITALSRCNSLFVIARNSSFTYKGKSVDTRQVGRELGVRYLLEGSVRRSSDRLRFTRTTDRRDKRHEHLGRSLRGSDERRIRSPGSHYRKRSHRHRAELATR